MHSSGARLIRSTATVNLLLPPIMDDYSLASLAESKNEWCARLVNALTPAVIEGLRSIFKEAEDLCAREDQEDKYLMTFQTYLSRIPKWNEDIIKSERERIEERSRCGYLEDLITCVHVVQLKALTCVRVGQKQKAVDLDVPSANAFVHKVYTLAARRLYTSVYLFEKEVPPLERQKLNRELEILVKESIMDAIRDSVPVEKILKAYVAQTEEPVNEEGDGIPLPPPNPSSTADPAAAPNTVVASTPIAASTPVPVPSTKTPPVTPAPVEVSVTTPKVEAANPSVASSPDSEPIKLVVDESKSHADPISSILSVPSPRTDEEATKAVISAIESLPEPSPSVPSNNTTQDPGSTLTFANEDRAVSTTGREEVLEAPKDDKGLRQAEERREAKEAAAPPIDDEPIAMAIKEMGGVSGLPDVDLGIEDIEVLE